MPAIGIAFLQISLDALLLFLIFYGLRRGARTHSTGWMAFFAGAARKALFILPGTETLFNKAVHYVGNVFGRAAEAVAMPVANFFAHLASLIEYTAFSGYYFARDTFAALYGLRHAVIPRLIHIAIWPLHEAIRGVQRVERWAMRELRAGEVTLKREIGYAEGLAATALATAIIALRHGFVDVIPRGIAWPGIDVRKWWGDTIRTLRRRLTRVEQLALGGLAAGVILRVLAKHLPWFRCANVSRTMKQLCRTPYGFLTDLLALAADFFVLTHICTVIPWLEAAFETVASPLIDVLARAGAGVCDGAHDYGGPLTTPTLHLPAATGTQLYIA